MPYHPPDSLRAAVARCVERGGGRVERRVIGYSVRAREIEAVTVRGREPVGPRPAAVVVANIHGVEVVSAEVALGVLERLIAGGPGSLADAVLARGDVTVVPVLNPDGRSAAFASLSRRRPYVNAPRGNANGVDLNRNWPVVAGAEDHWSPWSGTGRRRLPWFRGAAPLSEPETAAFADLLRRLRPTAMLNLHSLGRILTYPWSSRADEPADRIRFEAVAEAFVAAQPRWRYRWKQSSAWYPILGASNDYAYERYGTLAMTVETSARAEAVRARPGLGRWAFWYHNPIDPALCVDNDADACLAALALALEPDPGRTGRARSASVSGR